jgi:hypothetical protein
MYNSVFLIYALTLQKNRRLNHNLALFSLSIVYLEFCSSYYFVKSAEEIKLY